MGARLENETVSNGDMRMNGIIWHEKRIIYFYIPKCGCTTLKKVFADGQGLHYDNPHSAPFERCTPEQAASMAGYSSFAVVRNPLDRLLSLYRDKVRPGYRGWGFKGGVENFVFSPYGVFIEDMSFRQFAEACLSIPLHDANPHWAPQAWQVSAGEWMPETIIRFERFAEGVPSFLARFGIEAELPRLNQAWQQDSRPWPEWYSGELLEKAKAYYRKDIELWYNSLLTASRTK